jgi:ubiquinone/menaquinone biosynthesis C-methylase UbiE
VKAYYEARAREYDDWWLGLGRFRERERPGWEEELAALRVTLESLPPARTLDVACGTGFLTRHLSGRITALDQSPSMLDVAAEQAPEAELVLGDGLSLPFDNGSFERVFTSHFYGHLDETEREHFLAEARRVADELVVVDSAVRAETPPILMQERVLNDGSRWAVLKRYFTGDELSEELGGGQVLHESQYFVVVRA